MQLPHFSLSKFGITHVKRISKEQVIRYYELEFYTQDHPGGTCTDGVFRSAKKGHFALYRPGQRQTLVAPYSCYYLNISTQDPILCEFFDNLPAFGPVWDMDAVIAQIRKMQSAEDKETLAGRLYLESCAAQVLSLLAKQPMNGKKSLVHREDLQTADRYIREHLSEDLDLKTLARVAGLDPTYFHKLYTRAYGKTPAQAILSRRITAAQIALEEGTLSVAQIADACGFSSQAYFAAKFREITRKTPTQYRKEKQQSGKV